MSNTIEHLVEPQQLFIQQHAHVSEVLLNWERKNEYIVSNLEGQSVGWISEQGSGFANTMTRQFMGSHRSLEVTVTLTAYDEPAMYMRRAFFFYFSELNLLRPGGELLGQVQRRFGLLQRKYDLLDHEGQVFATIRGPIWRPWTFRIFDQSEQHVATITKKWKGLTKEVLTNADNFLIDYGDARWTGVQKAVILGAAIAIDFDFFEQRNNG